MRIISKSRLREFWETPGHQDAEGPLRAWHTHVSSRTVAWNSWGDVKADFGTGSIVGNCVVFNIGGNKYRMVARILYPSQKVFILKVMTHGEYEKEIKNKYGLKGKDRESYLELVLTFPLASIQSEEHLEAAQVVINRMLAKGDLDHGEEMYLDALSDLVATYEDQHHAIEPAADAELLRHLMEAKGVSQMHLSRDTGIARSTISEVLAGKKPFSRQIIRKLADYFNVDVSILAANI